MAEAAEAVEAVEAGAAWWLARRLARRLARCRPPHCHSRLAASAVAGNRSNSSCGLRRVAASCMAVRVRPWGRPPVQARPGVLVVAQRGEEGEGWGEGGGAARLGWSGLRHPRARHRPFVRPAR